ncbi:MAG: histidinol phosphatase [Ruminococcaceae bacterium]|nr:histidinol phosphatase [Oscillospiraceae bacterium]
MYLYETHLHTAPVSRCARATPEETVRYYKEIGYAGIFVTNHFIDGNIDVDRSLPYEERIRFYFSDYEKALAVGQALGISVFCGVEMTYGGTDFLVYGLDREWYLAHPEIEGMPKSKLLPMLIDEGALVIHAHPFREASYIDHIRLYPRCVHGVERFNACRSEFENRLAGQYAENYGLIPFAGSDNHAASGLTTLGGMRTEKPIADEADFVRTVLAGGAEPFKRLPDGTVIAV